MEIQEDRRGDVVVLTPGGDMDSSTLPNFENRFAALLQGGARAVVWNLEHVGILPSAGVGFLLQAGRRIKEVDGEMALAAAGKLARATLETLGVLQAFPLYDTVDAAVKDLD
jgi:anti-sigma B factor antagonist